MTPMLLAILVVIGLSLLVLAAGATVRGLSERSDAPAPRSARRSLFGVFLRAPAAGDGKPDYAMTGNYWPANYWSVYWPIYGSEGGGGVARGRLLGNGLVVAGRGVSEAM